MPVARPHFTRFGSVALVLVALAMMTPPAAEAASANHDVQRIMLHRCALKHDRAAGPSFAGAAPSAPGLN